MKREFIRLPSGGGRWHIPTEEGLHVWCGREIHSIQAVTNAESFPERMCRTCQRHADNIAEAHRRGIGVVEMYYQKRGRRFIRR